MQVKYYNRLKKMPKKDECIVHVDYSENYNKQQDVTQSAYFGHATFGLLKAADIFAPLILPSSEKCHWLL